MHVILTMQNSNPRKKKPAFVFAFAFGLLAALVLYMAHATYQSSRHSVEEFRTASGRVISLKVIDSDRTGRTEAPVVQFQTSNGTEIIFESEVGSNPPSHGVGETVEVFYDPEDPQKAVINSFVHLWLLPTVLAGVGGIFILVSLIAFYVARLDQ